MKLSEKTGRGYSAAIKFLLSYSAFECACKASSVASNTIELYLNKRDLNWVVSRLIKVFAPTTLARENLVNSVTSPRLRKKVEEFLLGGHVNLQPICAALRNMIAHGHWTPNGTSALTAECIKIYDLLSYALLKGSDKLLELEVKKAEIL
jgi:tartrate dehydratase beta subunit/fumarate hydratase class I family protein